MRLRDRGRGFGFGALASASFRSASFTSFSSRASKYDVASTEMEEVRLCPISNMKPLITKMDNALSTLKKCKHLRMSSNAIGKIEGLAGMDSLQILSLGRNAIKKIEGLNEVADTLEQLWISYNQIASFAGIEKLVSLLHPRVNDEVRAEATVSLRGCRFEAAQEWSEIRRHDVVFLLTLHAVVTERGEGSKPDLDAPFPIQIEDATGELASLDLKPGQLAKGEVLAVETWGVLVSFGEKIRLSALWVTCRHTDGPSCRKVQCA